MSRKWRDRVHIGNTGRARGSVLAGQGCLTVAAADSFLLEDFIQVLMF